MRTSLKKTGEDHSFKPPGEETMYYYDIYGLKIQSDLTLPGLAIGNGCIDVNIRIGPVDHPSQVEMLDGGCLFWASGDTAYLCCEQVGACKVQSGREIVVSPAPEVGEADLRLLVIGPALTVLLQQRGYIVLHGSVVEFDGAGVAFLGDSGAGKSTLGATFASRGRRVLADDLTVVRFERDEPYVLPGPPQVRLLPDSARALGYDPTSMPRIHPALEKRVLEITERGCRDAVPLRQIYCLLSDTPEAMMTLLDPRAAFLALAGYYYLHAVAFLKAIGGEAQLLQCAKLAGVVPVRGLRQHPSFTVVDSLDSLIERQLAEETATAL